MEALHCSSVAGLWKEQYDKWQLRLHARSPRPVWTALVGSAEPNFRQERSASPEQRRTVTSVGARAFATIQPRRTIDRSCGVFHARVKIRLSMAKLESNTAA